MYFHDTIHGHNVYLRLESFVTIREKYFHDTIHGHKGYLALDPFVTMKEKHHPFFKMKTPVPF
jgi:hypothetical protein